MFRQVQCTNHMHSVHELVCIPNNYVIPVSKIPSLAKIAAQFISGRPIDSSLNRNLGYNDIEDNPLLKKGVDLADLSDIAEKVNSTLHETQEALERQKVANKVSVEGKSQIDNPDANEPPKKVE